MYDNGILHHIKPYEPYIMGRLLYHQPAFFSKCLVKYIGWEAFEDLLEAWTMCSFQVGHTWADCWPTPLDFKKKKSNLR